MKQIGFVDYYISEWHANNYPAWFQEAAEKLGVEYQVAYAWAEKDISPVDGVSTDEWCEKMGVERCHSLAELCEKSDVIVILAPSNPEKHLEYAAEKMFRLLAVGMQIQAREDVLHTAGVELRHEKYEET